MTFTGKIFFIRLKLAINSVINYTYVKFYNDKKNKILHFHKFSQLAGYFYMCFAMIYIALLFCTVGPVNDPDLSSNCTYSPSMEPLSPPQPAKGTI